MNTTSKNPGERCSMASVSESELYSEQEAESMQDHIKRNLEHIVFFKTITFDNVDKARKMLKAFKEDKEFTERMIKELEQKIKEYSEFVENDIEGAMESER